MIKNEKKVFIQEIKKIVAEIAEIDINEINENMSLHDGLGIDSLDMEEIIMEIEDKYEIIFKDDELEYMDTIDEIVENLLKN